MARSGTPALSACVFSAAKRRRSSPLRSMVAASQTAPGAYGAELVQRVFQLAVPGLWHNDQKQAAHMAQQISQRERAVALVGAALAKCE
jgi:hypothetical protein